MRTFILCAILAAALAIDPIVIKGNKFFNSVTGQQFYIVGVDYQPFHSSPNPPDPLNLAGLQRDVPYLKNLTVNTIRVYKSSSTTDFTASMNYLADNGIYVLIDATDSAFSISNSDPSWNLDIFENIKKKIDNYIAFPNVIGFLGGNEVLTSDDETAAAAYVKASIRDIKAYIKSKGYSTPVGYAATDINSNTNLQKYLDCLSRDTSVDFYGLNTYRYCGNVSFDQTSYPQLVQDFSDYHAPFIFTEFGCNTVSPRIFREIDSIYGPDMDSFLSGGFVYEYSQEANNYGLVNISADGTTVTITQDYINLRERFSNINPSRTNLTAYTGTTATVDVCPPFNATSWRSQSSPLPPSANDTLCSCMQSQLTCVTSVSNVSAINDTYAASIAENLGSICGTPAFCSAISYNSTAGLYGVYSGCNSLQRASYALNIYYNQFKSSQGDGACGFSSAALVTPSNNCAAGVTADTSAGYVSSSTFSTSTATTSTSSTVAATTTTVTATTSNGGNTGSSTGSSTGSTGSSTGSSGSTGRDTVGSAGVVVPLAGLMMIAAAFSL